MTMINVKLMIKPPNGNGDKNKTGNLPWMTAIRSIVTKRRETVSEPISVSQVELLVAVVVVYVAAAAETGAAAAVVVVVVAVAFGFVFAVDFPSLVLPEDGWKSTFAATATTASAATGFFSCSPHRDLHHNGGTSITA